MSYARSAKIYDKLYSARDKDYASEVEKLRHFVHRYSQSSGNRLLDVACGTGRHIQFLQAHYSVTGVDICPEMLELARRRCPDVTFIRGDMAELEMEERFDIVTCLFSSIAYVKTLERLDQTLENFARLLHPGGVVIVEPWFTPDMWNAGTIHADFLDEPELKICRMNVSEVQGRTSVMVFHYQVGTPGGIDYFTERHEGGLFTGEEYLGAFRNNGLSVIHDREGLMGRGLYIGIKQSK